MIMNRSKELILWFDELSKKDIAVTVIESGKFQKLGTEMRALNFYSGTTFCPAEKSIEGTELLRTVMVGGSSIVTIGNGIRSLERELKKHNIDLTAEFEEAEAELKNIETVKNEIVEKQKAYSSLDIEKIDIEKALEKLYAFDLEEQTKLMEKEKAILNRLVQKDNMIILIEEKTKTRTSTASKTPSKY